MDEPQKLILRQVPEEERSLVTISADECYNLCSKAVLREGIDYVLLNGPITGVLYKTGRDNESK